MLTPQQILEELKKVKYPGFSRDIVSFGMIKDIEVGSTAVNVIVAANTGREDILEQIRAGIIDTVSRMPGAPPIEVSIAALEQPQRRMQQGPTEIPGVAHIVAVASGKGGVGKSTIAANLALALGSLGQRVGLLDADVYGPSIPLMLGLRERPQSTEAQRIIPLQRFGMKVISLGLFVTEATPVIWRGPMITKLLTQFLRDVEWGDLDYLVLDLPPGTGDAQLTITQQVPLTGGIIVTTPQEVALEDVKRGISMFNQVNAPVLGVIENMSYHLCPGCGERAEIFGHGGGEAMAERFQIPFLGSLPLIGALREAADAGVPLVVAQPQHPQSQALLAIAQRLRGVVAGQPTAAPPHIH